MRNIMEISDISIGRPSLNSGNYEKPTDTSVLGKEKINSLKNSIEEIEFLIKERESLSKSLSDETEKIKTSIENFLLKNVATDSEDFKERNGLRQKQIEVSELQLNERITCWKDVALLKKELRECQKELSEKQERMDMFGNILGNGGSN